ncbi:MAG: hypothetical protein Q8Q12_17825 [bacterium]|nr:hypothetical protein [bacterium]
MNNTTFCSASPAHPRNLQRDSAWLLACVLAVAMSGCRGRDSDPRLVDIAIKAETASARIRELSLVLNGMNARLTALEESLRSVTRASVAGGETAAPSTGASKPDIAQVQRLSEQVAVLSEELVTTRQDLASAWGAVEKIGTKLSASEGGNIEEALYKLVGKPDKFIEMLDALLSTISPTIQDAATRYSFEAEIARLRDRALSPPSSQELFDEFRARHVEKLNAVTDENDRQAVEHAIAELDNAREEELRKRLDKYGRQQTLEELGRIAKQYSLRKEDLVAVLSEYIKKD